jgi:hypothetical protein
MSRPKAITVTPQTLPLIVGKFYRKVEDFDLDELSVIFIFIFIYYISFIAIFKNDDTSEIKRFKCRPKFENLSDETIEMSHTVC